MALIPISEAVVLCGKDRRTIERHIKSGKLSGAALPDGRRAIDAAELLRVYGAFKAIAADAAPTIAQDCRILPHNDMGNLSIDVAVKLAQLETENAALKSRIEDKDKHLIDKDKNLDDLRRSILLLENKSSQQPKKKRFWLF